MMQSHSNALRTGVAGALMLVASTGFAASVCKNLPDHAQLKVALDGAAATETSGLDHHMWATIVDRDGEVCAVAFSGNESG